MTLEPLSLLMPNINITIRVADWKEDKGRLQRIRRLVFIEEQNVPEELEWDEYDTVSTHFIVTRDNKAVATARLKPDGQIGRMAVLAEHRNQGIGGSLLAYVIKSASRKNIKQLYLHAQVAAIPFYEKHGFKPDSDLFYEADIPHRKMTLTVC